MRVLVAEDHGPLARSIANGLREEGFAVDLTASGEEALTWGIKSPYDCVVLDIMLPDREGWSVLEHLRERGIRSPIMLLTARDAVEDRVRGLNLGADDYLVKPFAWEELLARVRALVRRAHGREASTIKVADLEIDTTAKSVRRAGKQIVLSAREYALLEYLAHRKGTVVSRSEISAHLYDNIDQTVSNVVDVYIGYLRKKLEAPGQPPLIHTRRGSGFILGLQQ